MFSTAYLPFSRRTKRGEADPRDKSHKAPLPMGRDCALSCAVHAVCQEPFELCLYLSLNSLFNNFPDGFFGKLSANTTDFGALNPAMCLLQ